MMIMNQQSFDADRSDPDRSLAGAYELLRSVKTAYAYTVHPLEWPRIDADQSEIVDGRSFL